MENPIYKWMIYGTRILGHHPYFAGYTMLYH